MTLTAQNIVFVTDTPWQALSAPPNYALAVSADPAYREWESGAWLAAARAQGRTLYTWCDCSSTPASEAIRLAQQHGFAGWIGQAENSEQFHHFLRAAGLE